MCELTKYNFNDKFNQVEEVLKKAVLVSVDCEFSALYVKNEYRGTLFDSPCQRYQMMRKNLQNSIPLEIGITAFCFDKDMASYTAIPYKFYIFPVHFGLIDKTFKCQTSGFSFLSEHKFDFNKVFYEGIPYLNKDQEKLIKGYVDNNYLYDYCNYTVDIVKKKFIEAQIASISKWFYSNKSEKQKIIFSGRKNYDIIYLLHKDIRAKYPKQVWTYEEDDKFMVKRVSTEEYEQLYTESLENKLFINLLGFTRIYRLLVSLKKPIIGHNFLYDLLLLYHTFENPLPESYTLFKQIIHEQFPSVYDTKTISFELLKYLTDDEKWKGNGLQDLYEFFKNKCGRHLVPASPQIEIDKEFNTYYADDKFHDAGWDAYCTGYCFIRMAHFFAAEGIEEMPKLKKFLSTEHLKAVERFKNKVNIIRADVPNLNLSGTDPESMRPPYLIIQSKNNKPIDIHKMSGLLREYGSVDIRSHSSKGKRVIAAVSNFGNARRILTQFQNHKDFKIVPYNAIKHSPVVQTALWVGIVASGSILAWFLHQNK